MEIRKETSSIGTTSVTPRMCCSRRLTRAHWSMTSLTTRLTTRRKADRLEAMLIDKLQEETTIDDTIKTITTNTRDKINEKSDKESILKNLEANIENQRRIHQDYHEKIITKKIESAQFIEKLKQQQKVLDTKLIRIGKNLGILFEAQEELAFIYDAQKVSSKATRDFLTLSKTIRPKHRLRP